MKRSTTSDPQSIAKICARASIWTIAATLLMLVLLLGGTFIQETRSARETSKRHLSLIAPLLVRSISGELLVGDERALNTVRRSLIHEFSLDTLEVTANATLCPKEGDIACWTGQVPDVYPARHLRFTARLGNRIFASGLLVLLSVCLPLFGFGLFAANRIRRVLDEFIVKPIQDLVRNPEEWNSNDGRVAAETIALQSRLMAYIRERDTLRDQKVKLQMQASLGEMASQVAHDIKSPLAALDMILNDLTKMPEDHRLIVRSAVGRIKDIANNLLIKNRQSLSGNIDTESQTDEKTCQLIPSLIGDLVTEKRLQFRPKLGVLIEERLNASAYGLFATVQVTEFKRLLSNLVNNSVEAMGEAGRVLVEVSSHAEEICVRLRDNGKGIPAEVLPRLMNRGETHGKAEGSGLGLYHAKTTLESWGGRLQIESKLGEGTSVSIVVPRAKAPTWFVPEICLKPESIIVVLDDDSSIHQVWDRRFSELSSKPATVRLVHFSTPAELTQWKRDPHLGSCNIIYLVDYELLGQNETGIDIIERLQIQDQSILVTSRFEDQAVRVRCEKLGVKLIPKSMAGFVPISIRAPSEHWDGILLDDDVLVHLLWKNAAAKTKKKFLGFQSAQEFERHLSQLEHSTPIYLDSQLGEGVRGEDLAKRLHAQGFQNLFMATGYNAERFEAMPWLKVVGKDPPEAWNAIHTVSESAQT